MMAILLTIVCWPLSWLTYLLGCVPVILGVYVPPLNWWYPTHIGLMLCGAYIYRASQWFQEIAERTWPSDFNWGWPWS